MNTILLILLLGQVQTYQPTQETYLRMQRELTEMRMQQTQPHYAQRSTPLPPGCGPYWDAQRSYQYYSQPYYHQPYYYQPYYYQPYYQPYYHQPYYYPYRYR